MSPSVEHRSIPIDQIGTIDGTQVRPKIDQPQPKEGRFD